MNNRIETRVINSFAKLLESIKHMQGNTDPAIALVDPKAYDQRKLAIAKTNLETGMYWLQDAINGYRQPEYKQRYTTATELAATEESNR